jgi:hypothetical protein
MPGSVRNVQILRIELADNGQPKEYTDYIDTFSVSSADVRTSLELTYSPKDPEAMAIFDQSVFLTYTDFKDGKTEFTSITDGYAYSVDANNKKIYFSAPVSEIFASDDATETEISITYTGYNVDLLGYEDFSVKESNYNKGFLTLLLPETNGGAYRYVAVYDSQVKIDESLYEYDGNANAVRIEDFGKYDAFKEMEVSHLKIAYSYNFSSQEYLDALRGRVTPVIDELQIIYRDDNV